VWLRAESRGNLGVAVKALLVDSHAIVRAGLRAILEKAGIHVIGECTNGREAIAFVRRSPPNVILMAVSMPELNGIDATQQIVSELPDIKVIGLSIHPDHRHAVAMFSAGASGYL